MKVNKGTKVQSTRTTNTGFKGISQHKNNKLYETSFSFLGNKVYIGAYKTLPEAVTARVQYINTLV